MDLIQAKNKIPIWVACPRLGASSEPWISRQILNFSRSTSTIICWKDLNPHKSVELGEVHTLPFRLIPNRFTRWYTYLHNSLNGNFLGSIGREKNMLIDLYEQRPPAAILCHFGHIALRLLPIADHKKIPLIVHFHGLDLSSMLRNKWYRRSLLSSLNRFTNIVVVGSHQRQWMLENGLSKDRVHLIPCGVPTSEFKPNSSKSTNVRFICVSRLVPWKGIDYSIRAFAITKQSVPNAKLIIIGKGNSQQELIKLSQNLGIESDVEFIGAQPPDRVKKELQSSTIFLQHSLTTSAAREGFGVSITEASATGLPVVATHCGGIPDQITDGENGFLVPERDTNAMAKAMIKLGKDDVLRKRMGDLGRRRAIELFDTNILSNKLEELLINSVT